LTSSGRNPPSPVNCTPPCSARSISSSSQASSASCSRSCRPLTGLGGTQPDWSSSVTVTACSQLGQPPQARTTSTYTDHLTGPTLLRPGRFAAAVTAAGSRLIHSSPYHPQTLGKCERLHQTADKLLNHFFDGPAASIAELQARLDQVRTHYNTRRRHSAVASTPQRAWDRAPAHGGPQQLPLQTDATVHRLTVVAHGTVTLGDHAVIRVGAAHAGTQVTALVNGPQVTLYAASGEPLGQLTLDPAKRYQGKITAA